MHRRVTAGAGEASPVALEVPDEAHGLRIAGRAAIQGDVGGFRARPDGRQGPGQLMRQRTHTDKTTF